MAKLEPKRAVIALRGLTVASLKMYFRSRTAVFFSLIFPVIFISILGAIFNTSGTTFKVDLTNQSQSSLSQQFVGTLQKLPVFKIKTVDTATGASDLNKSNVDLQVIVPPQFGEFRGGQLAAAPIIAHYNAARPQNGQAATQILSQLTTALNNQITHAPQIVTVQATGVQTKNLTYIDFLLPGMVGMSVMQMAVFSVAFAFISFKTTGTLRRIMATPVHPGYFLLAQGVTRLIMSAAQSVLLVGIGIWLFHFHLSVSSWLPFLVLAVLGSIAFMGIGFAVTSWANNEDQAAPLVNLILFPQLFLGGVFFSRDNFPHVLQVITDHLPLTYLADALRHVANDGAGLWAVRTDLLGLCVWGVVMGIIAVRVFRWE